MIVDLKSPCLCWLGISAGLYGSKASRGGIASGSKDDVKEECFNMIQQYLSTTIHVLNLVNSIIVEGLSSNDMKSTSDGPPKRHIIWFRQF